MAHDQLPLHQAKLPIVAVWRWLILAPIAAFVTYVALRGISESWDNKNFPEPLAIKLELMPVIFPVHMVAGGLALLLVPLVLYLRGTAWHKFMGHIAAADIIVAGITAIPVALDAPVTQVSAAGFMAQGVTWMLLLGAGIWNIRLGRMAQHRAFMLMMAAVTSGALFFRIYLALSKLVVPHKYFYHFYAADAWLAWGLPLLGVAIWLRWTDDKNRNTIRAD